MKSITFEDYKKAIKVKYEIEKEGVYFNFLAPPSQANLRKLCWEIFRSNESKDDLNCFASFFGFEFDVNKKNSFTEQTDRFRPIGSFLKGEKVPSNRYAVELAAVLVDYQPRPYQKYKERGITYIEEPIVIPKIPFAFNINNGKEEENKIEKANEIEEEEKLILQYEEEIDDSKQTESFNNQEEIRVKIEVKDSQSVNLFVDDKAQKENKFNRRIKHSIMALLIVLCIGFAVIFFIFPNNKQCMQWSGDHYELVDCDLKIEGFGSYNKIEILDPSLVNLKKINICDTTTCFDKNGAAIIWYAKSANGVDFFNEHGRHPENNKPLKPVTQYIIDKYVK
ncbi:hypothetical protein ACEN2I_18535 [Flavobacterium sp. W22_SRS_FK3]|uniref:hypothetical protein n=1 Tax=Flavobacterium sp. W22_SRS_FK3 TaxID=3240275 RepID=UPI003F9373F5